VNGFFHHGNTGDQLFIEAFQYIFPNYNFIFKDEIEENDLKGIDAVFFGGGSFLDQHLNICDKAYSKIGEKKIFYIGVGLETNIDPFHRNLMERSELIAIRTPQFLEKAKKINENSIVIPDLVYALKPLCNKSEKIKNSILFIPNILVVPSWKGAHWGHSSWEHAKEQIAQTLDHLIESGKKINFFPMSKDKKLNDSFAAAEIINRMSYRNDYIIEANDFSIDFVSKIISKYEIVITQRFHGIVLSEMLDIPYISIHHHNKLKTNEGNGKHISYYELSKDALNSKINELKQFCCEEKSFLELKNTVCNLIGD
jgi:polysaccharide pyruvyl transferase WcaK-like protein